jgi:hypothetical protein
MGAFSRTRHRGLKWFIALEEDAIASLAQRLERTRRASDNRDSPVGPFGTAAWQQAAHLPEDEALAR